MKFSRSVLAVSLLVALQGVQAQGSIINENKVFEEDIEIQVDAVSSESSEKSNVYVGIEANNSDSKIVVSPGASLLVTGNQSSLGQAADRLYGISSQNKNSFILEGNSTINLMAETAQVRGIRAYSDISMKGSVQLNLVSESGIVVGLDGGNTAQIDISGDSFVVNAESTSGRIIGIQNYNRAGAEINLNSENIVIRTNNSSSKDSEAFNQALLSFQSTTNFNGNTFIEVYGGVADTYGIDIQCDPKNPYDSVVNLNGKITKIAVNGQKQAVAIRPSGVPGYLSINSDIVDLSSSTVAGLSMGARVQYGATLNISNPSADVRISAETQESHAIAIYSSTYGGDGTFQFGKTNIEAKKISLIAKGKNAYGIVSAVRNHPEKGYLVDLTNDGEGVFLKGETHINTVSQDGLSIGIAVSNKTNPEIKLDLKNKVVASDVTVASEAKNGGTAFAVYLNDNGKLELENARLSAVSDDGKAVGIYNNNGSIVKFTGNSFVQAETALQGNGTVDVETGAVLTLDGKILKDDWTGVINANGKVAYGVAESIAASDLANAIDGTLLVIAGTEIAGNVNVGTVMTRDTTAASHSLKVGSDGTILVRATDSYDGTSPLIKVDSVRAEKGSTVHLLNAAVVAEGTKIFESNDADEDSLEDYLFTTDNFLKKVENNRIVGEKSANVFGSDLLIPNVVDAAVNAANNEGADRILGLTNKALTQAQSLKAIHQIALMVPASGAQSTAINVANLQLDVIDTHASKLAFHAEDKVGADLWIDLNGFLSKTNEYSAGSAKFGYKSDLAGVTIGSDYSFGNGYAAGVSVAFGKGSVRGQGEGSGVKNDVDYYGVNLYGVWSNDYFNTIGSVGYLQTKNEIKTQGFKGKPDAKTVSVGVRFEKPLALNEAITVTPHLGVRYKHVKLDSFNAGGFKYTTEKADIVEVPFGVAFNANLKAPCGTDVKPFVDLTIAPNFGDRKVSNKIALAGTTASDSFDARIANNAMYNAKVGVNAVKGSHTFGLNYGIGGGNKGRVDQTLQARYTYRF